MMNQAMTWQACVGEINAVLGSMLLLDDDNNVMDTGVDNVTSNVDHGIDIINYCCNQQSNVNEIVIDALISLIIAIDKVGEKQNKSICTKIMKLIIPIIKTNSSLFSKKSGQDLIELINNYMSTALIASIISLQSLVLSKKENKATVDLSKSLAENVQLLQFFSQRVAAAIAYLSSLLSEDIIPCITLLSCNCGFLKYASQCLNDLVADTHVGAVTTIIDETLQKYEEVIYKSMNLPISSANNNHHFQVSLFQKASKLFYENDCYDLSSSTNTSMELLHTSFCCVGFLNFSMFSLKTFGMQVPTNKSLLHEHCIANIELFILSASKLCVAYSGTFHDKEVTASILQTIPLIIKSMKGSAKRNFELFQHINAVFLSHCCDASADRAKGFIARVLLCGCFLKYSDRRKCCLLRNIWSLVIKISSLGRSRSINPHLFSLVCSSLATTIQCILSVSKSSFVGILLGNISVELKNDKSLVCRYILEKILMKIPWEQLRSTKGQETKTLIDQALKVISTRIGETNSFDQCSGFYLSVLGGLAKLNNAERDINSILMPKIVSLGKYVAGFQYNESNNKTAESSLRLERLCMALSTLSVSHHFIDNLTTDHCLEMLKISSAMSSACLMLCAHAASSYISKKRKFGDEVIDGHEKEEIGLFENVRFFAYCACQITTKSIQCYHKRKHGNYQQFGVEHLRTIFQSLFKVSETMPTSWTLVSILVTSITEIGNSLVSNQAALMKFKDVVPEMLKILLRARQNGNKVSLKRQKILEADINDNKSEALVYKLWLQVFNH